MSKKDIRDIFFPFNCEKENYLKTHNVGLAHYCTADTACKIFESESFWMRNAKCMNDYEEITHGWKNFSEVWNKNHKFYNTIETLFPKFFDKINEVMQEVLQRTNFDTYLTCLSEHELSDKLGRLSMWRAYGGANGVAIILNKTPFIEINNAYDNLYTSPVAYFDKEETINYFDTLADNIQAYKSQITQLSENDLDLIFTEIILSSVICNKNPGFEEEKEWRAVYMPFKEDMTNPNLLNKNITINDVPQRIFQIPLKEKLPSHGTGYNLNDIIEYVIIGPTDYPIVIMDALADSMQKAGIENAYSKISISKIPYRNNK